MRAVVASTLGRGHPGSAGLQRATASNTSGLNCGVRRSCIRATIGSSGRSGSVRLAVPRSPIRQAGTWQIPLLLRAVCLILLKCLVRDRVCPVAETNEAREPIMKKTWSKPQVEEQQVGMEVSSYLPAELDAR